MIMVRAIIRPEKAMDVLADLAAAGFPAATKMDVAGRGKQKGVVVGDVYYDEIPKEMILCVVHDEDKDTVVQTILHTARTGPNGAFGDGKIFVNKVAEAYTISSKKAEL
ncbi:MAG: P-II family nitrogen regulator [Peptococcaceae bacterium]|jgi:nitrogen regulatory protein PII 1|nr:P-II family nitrogen regulator [Peptococcaceae bacterium]